MGTTQITSVRRTPAEKGKRKTVLITVDFDGCADNEGDITDPNQYRFTFSGNEVDPRTGDVICRGEQGKTKEAQFVMRFILMPGDTIEDATFEKPMTFDEFEFHVGAGACGDRESDEFGKPKMKRKGTRIVVRNMKKNSDLELGYRFRVWITHFNGEVRGAEYDPRIINK